MEYRSKRTAQWHSRRPECFREDCVRFPPRAMHEHGELRGCHTRQWPCLYVLDKEGIDPTLQESSVLGLVARRIEAWLVLQTRSGCRDSRQWGGPGYILGTWMGVDRQGLPSGGWRRGGGLQKEQKEPGHAVTSGGKYRPSY